MASACATAPSRRTLPSRRPSEAAKPPLVVASALKPSQASSRAEPMSQGFASSRGRSELWTSKNPQQCRSGRPRRVRAYGVGADLSKRTTCRWPTRRFARTAPNQRPHRKNPVRSPVQSPASQRFCQDPTAGLSVLMTIDVCCMTTEAQHTRVVHPTKRPANTGPFESGRPDLNRGPHRPES
jgi:hypothetical protein